MPSPRVFGNGPGLKSMAMAPVFGEPQYEMVIQIDIRGLMKTSITKYPMGQPPTQLHVMGMLLDCMMGQFHGMRQAASLLVDPNGKGLAHGGEEKENNNGGGGDSSGGSSGT
jgi:hypothetical protein